MDKRIIKTRQALQDALLELIREMPFEEIEIQAITDRADTARVTFYRHYGKKEELLMDVIEDIYQHLQSNLVHITMEQVLDFRLPPPSQILFYFLANDRKLHKNLLTGSVSNLVQTRIRHYVVKQIIQAFSADPRFADLPLPLLANQIASTLIGNIIWWLSEDIPYSPEYMARLSHWTAITGVMTMLGRPELIIMPQPDAWRSPF